MNVSERGSLFSLRSRSFHVHFAFISFSSLIDFDAFFRENTQTNLILLSKEKQSVYVYMSKALDSKVWQNFQNFTFKNEIPRPSRIQQQFGVGKFYDRPVNVSDRE